ncbi:MAG: 2-phospho-L-lactate guanylyltransferase [Gammaproteobacteria bacterium]|nr:2-phospho-L-lactate guanylyltransferase [Gammaproteobacteria bacterium]
MPGIWAVVPVKAFDLAKQRLSGVLSPARRLELARLMLLDVLDALARVEHLAGLAVVTRDADAAGLARAFGADVFIEETDAGLTAAVIGAATRLTQRDCSGMLVLPSDVPGVSAAEVECLLARHRKGHGFTVVPAHDGRGTNAIVMTLPHTVELAYGDDSCRRHLLHARAAGVEPLVVSLPGIARDLDVPTDVAAFLRRPSSTRTWRSLAGQATALFRERKKSA